MNIVFGGLITGLVVVTALGVRAVAGRVCARLVIRRLAHGEGPTSRPGVLLAILPPPPRALVRGLTAAGVTLDGRAVWGSWLATGALMAVAALVVGGPGLVVVAVLTSTVGPLVGLRMAAGRADRLLEDALPDALEAMARALRSGASLRQAVGEAAEATTGILGHDLGGVAHEVHHGRSLVSALDQWAQARPLPGVRLATSALGLGAETGGAQARALDGVAATLRSRQAVGREVRALSSQARLSGVVITLAPLGFSALAAVSDDRTASFLLTTPLGLACLTGGITLDGVAALWMHRLSRIDA